MLGKLSPGQRAKLAALGLDVLKTHRGNGRAYNNVGAGGPPRGAVDLAGVTIPANERELGEMLADRQFLAKVATNTDQLSAFINAYAVKTQAPGTPLNAEVQRAIEESTQAAAIKWLKENPTASAGLRRLNQDAQWTPPQTRYAAGYNNKAPGAAIDREGTFEDTTDFLKHVYGYKNGSLRGPAEEKMRKHLDSYSEFVPADGGFLVPESMRSEILRVALETSITRSRARVIPMDTLKIAFPMIDSTSNVSNVYGGLVAYWTEEAAELTESQAKFGKIVLEAWKLTMLAIVSNELLSDSMISFTAFLEQLHPEAMAWFEDLAFMLGTGVGEPLGFLGTVNPATIAVAAEAGQAADTLLWLNIINMYSRMLPSSLNRGIWLCSPNAFPQLATMALEVGTAGSAVWLNNGVGGPPATILGRPLIISEKMKTVGDQGDLAFVDLGYYLIGDRMAMSTMASEHARFTRDQVVYRVISRVTGRPWIQSPITPQNNSSTLSPFVELAAR